MVGKTVYVMRAHRYPNGKREITESSFKVKAFRRMLEPGEAGRGIEEAPSNRKKRLVQFYAVHGGLRTVAIDDIVDIK